MTPAGESSKACAALAFAVGPVYTGARSAPEWGCRRRRGAGQEPAAPAAADGPLKSAILGENNARLYEYDKRAALATDRISTLEAEYERAGGERSNLRYGYVARS
jgi:hypothetical protein